MLSAPSSAVILIRFVYSLRQSELRWTTLRLVSGRLVPIVTAAVKAARKLVRCSLFANGPGLDPLSSLTGQQHQRRLRPRYDWLPSPYFLALQTPDISLGHNRVSGLDVSFIRRPVRSRFTADRARHLCHLIGNSWRSLSDISVQSEPMSHRISAPIPTIQRSLKYLQLYLYIMC